MTLKRPFASLVSTMKPLFSTIAHAISATSLRFVFSEHLNLAQILQEKIHAFFYLEIADGLLNRSLKGAELELACQRANLARRASAEIAENFKIDVALIVQGIFLRSINTGHFETKSGARVR